MRSGQLSKKRRAAFRRSLLINLAIGILGLVGVTVFAVIWGSPLAIHLPAFSLGGRILFGWLVIAIAFGLLFPGYLAVQARAVTTPPEFRQIGLGTAESLSKIEAPQARQPDATPELSRMVGIITNDATHWGPAATFDGFSWGFRLRPSQLPLPVKRVVPVLSSTWGSVESADQIDYPSLIPVVIVKLRDPKSAFGLCLGSIRSGDIVKYMSEHGVHVQLTDAKAF